MCFPCQTSGSRGSRLAEHSPSRETRTRTIGRHEFAFSRLETPLTPAAARRGDMAAGNGACEKDLRSSHAFAEVISFSRTFGGRGRSVSVPPFPAERLELALLNPAAHEFPRWLANFVYQLSLGPLDEDEDEQEQQQPDAEADTDLVWESTLLSRLAALHSEEPMRNPLRNASWFEVTAVQRVRTRGVLRLSSHAQLSYTCPLPVADTRIDQAEILRSICAWRLDELTDELTDDMPAADLRTVPFASDSDDAQYFFFGTEDCRVYRRAPPPSDAPCESRLRTWTRPFSPAPRGTPPSDDRALLLVFVSGPSPCREVPAKQKPPKKGSSQDPPATTWETVGTTLAELHAWAKKLKGANKCARQCARSRAGGEPRGSPSGAAPADPLPSSGWLPLAGGAVPPSPSPSHPRGHASRHSSPHQLFPPVGPVGRPPFRLKPEFKLHAALAGEIIPALEASQSARAADETRRRARALARGPEQTNNTLRWLT